EPMVSFEPLAGPASQGGEDESEGASGFTVAPRMFPLGLNRGVFVGFHGLSLSGGLANGENPLTFVDLDGGRHIHFIGNDEPNTGHLDGAVATADSLFLSDISTGGSLFGATGPGRGMIYQIQAVNRAPTLSDIGDRSINEGQTLNLDVSGTDRN